jgi:predicted CopG family antitoxin
MPESIYFTLCIIHSEAAMAKTLAVREDTWERMKKLLEAGDAKSFDELIRRLMDQNLRVPVSMFGIDRQRKIRLTQREHEELARDAH